MAQKKSVVLVTVDCLRADHCSFMGYPRPTTPFLNMLAAESLVFPTAIVAGAPTYYSLPAILASRYPLAWGREVLGIAVQEKNLASAFAEDGYKTAFFGAANPYLSEQFGYDFGFETFCDFLDGDPHASDSGDDSAGSSRWAGSLNRVLANVTHRIPGLGAAYDELYFQYCQRWAGPGAQSLDRMRRFPAADIIVGRAQSWLASVREQPFFLWLHFMDPHSPYYPKEEALKTMGDEKLTAARASYLNESWNRSDVGSKRLRPYHAEIVALYDAGIRWVDGQLSRLAEGLRESNVWENCIFALTADHGEEFLEHDGRYHAPSLMEELIHVPLLLRVPGVGNRTVSSNPFSLIHLAPTILEAAGSPVPAEFQGQSHCTQLEAGKSWSEPAIVESVAGYTNPFRREDRCGCRLLAVRDAEYKLTLNFAAQTEYLFNLKLDPGERSPLPENAAKPQRRRLLEIALAHLRSNARQRNSEAYLRAYLKTRVRDIAFHSNRAAPAESAYAARRASASLLG
ncbi:MAG: sulfatase-like hydrolase/transferase [Candidatus Sulfotelmatobacter sp.]